MYSPQGKIEPKSFRSVMGHLLVLTLVSANEKWEACALISVPRGGHACEGVSHFTLAVQLLPVLPGLPLTAMEQAATGHTRRATGPIHAGLLINSQG